jgi:hypothetical protein
VSAERASRSDTSLDTGIKETDIEKAVPFIRRGKGSAFYFHLTGVRVICVHTRPKVVSCSDMVIRGSGGMSGISRWWPVCLLATKHLLAIKDVTHSA